MRKLARAVESILIANNNDGYWTIRQFNLISYFSQALIPRVIPAKAGIQPGLGKWHWIPAFAGMTGFYCLRHVSNQAKSPD